MPDYNQRFCYDCKYFYFTFGEGGYSEYTPGSPPVMSCSKSHFDYSSDDFFNLKETICRAQTCKDFKQEETP